MRWFLAAGLCRQRLVQLGDGEEAVASQHVPQHLAVAGLEDVERQQGLREENGVGQGHHRHGIGHMERIHERE